MENQKAEDGRYYTPEIEEFHVDFEMETCSWLKTSDDDSWENYKITVENFNEFMSIYVGDLYPTEFRAKYLDQTDIESLGFIFTGKSIDIWFQKEGNFDMYNWTSYKIILHYHLSDHLLTIYADDPGCDDFTLFRGICRNISELKAILKQINI